EDRVKGGAWIDVTHRELVFWRAEPVPELERRFGAKWPGWSVRRQTEGWQTQLELSGRRAPGLHADPASLVRDVINIVLDERALHPKNVLQQMLQLEDESARLEPYILQHHPGVVLDRQKKISLLEELMARLAPPGREELPNLLFPVQTPQGER